MFRRRRSNPLKLFAIPFIILWGITAVVIEIIRLKAAKRMTVNSAATQSVNIGELK